MTQPQAARFATATLFAVNGGAAANWIVRIPAVQEELDLSTGRLGVALLGVAIGSLFSMPPTGLLVAKLGSRPVSYGMALALCAALPLPAFAPGLLSLVGALVLLGAGMGGMDVAMNAQGVAVQRRYDRPIISSFHAVFSLGGLVGSAMGGAIAELGVDPGPHFLGVALVSAGTVVLVSRWLLPASADAVSHGPMIARPSRALAALGILAFCVLMAEGAMADWTAVYLRQVVETGPGLAAAGYAVFSLTMAGGRLVGDRLVVR
jgi:MFS family permease